jgi:stress response protein YsnF
MSDEQNTYANLEELGGSKYEVADGGSNIKGWAVKNEHGADIGEVDELLFDPETLNVHYLVVDLDRDAFGDDAKRVLVPIHIAELSTDTETVVLPEVSSAHLSELPEYETGVLTADMQRQVNDLFDNRAAARIRGAAGADSVTSSIPAATQVTGEDTARIPVIEEHLEVGKRQVETGRTNITTRVVERKVEGAIDLKKERVEIERTPVNRPLTAADGDAFKEQNFEIIEHAEIPVVTKEARVVEEITIRKDVEQHQETIRETLRNTEVKAEHLDLRPGDSSERL